MALHSILGVWYDMGMVGVWHGGVWHGMVRVWHGTVGVWHGMIEVWYGMAL